MEMRRIIFALRGAKSHVCRSVVARDCPEWQRGAVKPLAELGTTCPCLAGHGKTGPRNGCLSVSFVHGRIDLTNVSDLSKFVSAVLYRGMDHPNYRAAVQSSAPRRKK